LTLLLIGVLAWAFDIQPVEASGYIYIRADGSIEPPTAPISTMDNVTYTFADNIYDEIVVQRNNIAVDGAGYTVQGTGSYYSPSRGIDLSNRNNVTIKNMEIRNFNRGIWLYLSSNNTLAGNNVTNNYFGIDVAAASPNNTISGNICNSNNQYGIVLWSSHDNLVSNNKVSDNHWGIATGYSDNNRILNNNVSKSRFGIDIQQPCNDIIIANNIVSENEDGIRVTSAFVETRYNTILNNNITYNSHGIYASRLSGSVIHHNNFVNNTDQAYTTISVSVWDDDYPSGGNYWSDYVGVDLHHGPYQNETGSDGIGDTPYLIDEDNQDNYPLMEPWSPIETVHATIDIDPDTLNLRSRGKWITCYVELPEGYNVSDIDVTSVMLNDTVPVCLKAHAIGDYDEDGIPDLMVKFGRAEVIDYIMANVNMTELFEEKFMTVTLTITGKLDDGTPIQGNTKIRIIARAGLPKINTKISFNLSPNPALSGQTITLTGNLKNQLGNAIGNAPIEVYYSIDNGRNWVYAGTIQTNSAGWFSAKGKLTIVGIFPIAVVYRGNFRYSQSYRIEKLTVKLP